MKKRFGVLRILATVLKVLGIITAALAVLGAIGTLIASFAGGSLWSALGYDANTGFFVGLLTSFGMLVLGALYAVIMYGYGEMLMLMISIEDNTFKTVTLLEDVTKDDKA
jgi:predicted membrane protein